MNHEDKRLFLLSLATSLRVPAVRGCVPETVKGDRENSDELGKNQLQMK